MDTTEQKSTEEVSLENCDKEPVHIPGHIQDIAVLLALDPAGKQILYCSNNTELVFGQPADALLGKDLDTVLDQKTIHDINNALSLSSTHIQRERAGPWKNESNSANFDIWVHVSDTLPVLEFERVSAEELTQFEAIRNVRSLLARLNQIESIDRTLDNAVIGLRDLSGYDRVMVYRFDSNGDGEIKAEAKGHDAESFLGLRFPKWDIPQQAREILKKTPLRLIADVDGVGVPLLTQTADAPPLDLTLASSRGQSPIHSEYLRNMGVAATMTLSILVRGELWGLFAFHNLTPRCIGPVTRGAAELFVQFFAMQLEQRLEQDVQKRREQSQSYADTLFSASESASTLTDLVMPIASELCEHMEADGIAIVDNGQVASHGVTPDKTLIPEIGTQLLENTDADHYSTVCLLEHGFDAPPCAGALVVSIDEHRDTYVVYFRAEALKDVIWAGAPEKTLVHEEDTIRLKPRASFQAYQDSIENKCHPWVRHQLASALEIRTAMTKADLQRMNRKADRQRRIYIDELNHRIRNILALIRSLARSTKESSTSLETYARALEQRITALSAAHDMAANRLAQGVEINEIFRTELQAFSGDQGQRLTLQGEHYQIRADYAPIFALIVHELMTNSVKHGALSVPDGHIDIELAQANQGINICWTESGGPTATEPVNKGFGFNLITNAIPYEMDGTCTVEFAPAGLIVRLWIPLNLVEPVVAPAHLTHSAEPSAHIDDDEFPQRVLIVEDSMMIAMDMADMLAHIGVKTIEKCSSVKKAKATLEQFDPEIALLDIGLNNEQSFEVADILLSRKIPFCFASGYGSNFRIPDKFAQTTLLTKPVQFDDLKSMVKTLYQQRVQ